MIADITQFVWGTTTHPDRNIGRELTRHLIARDSGRTLCGHRVAFVFDFATPLCRECRQCARVHSRGITHARMRAIGNDE